MTNSTKFVAERSRVGSVGGRRRGEREMGARRNAFGQTVVVAGRHDDSKGRTPCPDTRLVASTARRRS